MVRPLYDLRARTRRPLVRAWRAPAVTPAAAPAPRTRPAKSDRCWFYADGAARCGPVTAGGLRDLARAGLANGATLVWREGQDDWEAAHLHVPGLRPGAPVPSAYGIDLPALVPPPPRRRGPPRRYDEPVDLSEAVGRLVLNYANLAGRASRGEFWLALFAAVMGFLAAVVIDGIFDPTMNRHTLTLVFVWALVPPLLTLTVRRLHDTGRSAAWMGLLLLPGLGWAILLLWLARRGQAHPNRFG